MVRENLEKVRENIEKACKKVGRDPSEVILLAVSKTKPIEMIEEAIASGQKVFGENKVKRAIILKSNEKIFVKDIVLV